MKHTKAGGVKTPNFLKKGESKTARPSKGKTLGKKDEAAIRMQDVSRRKGVLL